MKQPRPLRENRKHGDLLFPVSAYETKMEEDFQMPLSYHWHPEIEIFFITSGKANFQVEAEQFVIEEGDVLLIKPNTLHGSHDCFWTKLEFRAVVFDYSFLSGMANDRIEQKYLQPLLAQEQGRYILLREKNSIQKALFEMLNKTFFVFDEKEKGYELLVRAYLLQVVYDIIIFQEEEIQPVKANTRKSEMIRKIVGFVEENYTQRIVLNSLAAYLSVSEGYLCRFFRENFHMTFVEYVQRVRFRKAERLLKETDDPVGKIALDVGFGSGNYFTTEFGKLYHTTPQKYRKGQDT